MKIHLWWIVPAVLIIADVYGAFSPDTVTVAAWLLLILSAFFAHGFFDQMREKQAYKSALYDIRLCEENLAEQSRASKGASLIKANGKVWQIADAAISCQTTPDSQEYKVFVWERNNVTTWGG